MKKRFVEATIQEELTHYVGAKRYERTSERVNVRNGYWRRYIVLKDDKLHIKRPRASNQDFTVRYNSRIYKKAG